MSSVVGVLSKAAFRKYGKQTSWPAAGETFPLDAPGTGHAIPLISENFTSEYGRDEVDTLYNRAARTAGQVVAKLHRGNITLQGMYNNLGQILTCAMGFENPNDPGATYHGSPEASSPRYIHIYELDDVLAEEDWSSAERLASGSGGGTWTTADDKMRAGALHFLKGFHWIFAPLMWDKMTFQANFERVALQLDGIAQDYDRDSESGDAWTLAADESRLLMSDATFTIGRIDGSGLTYTTRGITDFELIMERGLAVDRDTLSTVYIKEPQINQMRKCYGSFGLPRYEIDDYLDAIDLDKPCKGVLSFISGSYQFHIFIPYITLTKPDVNIKGPGVVRPKYAFDLSKPASDPFAGSAYYGNIALKKLGEFWIVVKNDDPTNWLRTDPV